MKTILKSILATSLTFASLTSVAQEKINVMPFASEAIKLFPNVRDIAISTAQNEAYFSAQSHMGELSAIMRIVKKKGKWSAPELVHFSGKYQDLEPFLSRDGLRLYFASNRPLNESNGSAKDYDIWYVERSSAKGDWSQPVNMGAPINTEGNEFFASIADNGNFYFTSDAPNSKGLDDIYISEWKNGKYQPPTSLGEGINSKGYEFNAFVAPDESFIIFTGYNRQGGLGSGDLYLSRRNSSGVWEPAKNLGSSINSDKMDYCPYVDMTTKKLYFTSKRLKTHIEPTEFTSTKEFLEEMNKFENGRSRIYSVSLKGLLD